MLNSSNKALKITYHIIEANFYFSLVILTFGSAISLSDTYTLFDFNTDIYGELANNLRIMMVYLAFSSALIFGYCFLTKHFQYYLLVGFFLILMVGSLKFYGQVNNVEIDPNLDPFFFYSGFSHLLFGWMAIAQNQHSEQHEL